MIYDHASQGFGGQAKGYYTIAIVVILSLLALWTSRSGTLLATSSVTTVSNEVVTAEVFYAAEVALAEGMSWVESNDPTTEAQSGTTVGNSGSNNSPRSYATSFWFEQSGDFTRVYGRATGQDGSSATVTRWLTTGIDVLGESALKQPLGMAGTLSNVTGTPEINAIGSSGTIPTDYYSLVVSHGEVPSDYGNLNNSSGEPIVAGEWSAGTSDIWDQYFSIDRVAMEALATPGGRIRWYEPGEGPSTSLGTITSPVILIFEDCPQITGQKLIIGVIFIDDSSGCDLNGWSMDLKGSLGVNGDVSKLNSNTDLEAYYIESDDSVISVGSGGSAVGLGDFDLDSFTTKVTSPGTWTDMEVD
jgi:hypothetical protein